MKFMERDQDFPTVSSSNHFDFTGNVRESDDLDSELYCGAAGFESFEACIKHLDSFWNDVAGSALAAGAQLATEYMRAE